MHGRKQGRGAAVAALAMAVAAGSARADDNNGFFGRLFRLGGNPSGASSPSSSAFPGPASRPSARPGADAAPRGSASQFGDIGPSTPGGPLIPPAGSQARPPAVTPAIGPVSGEGPSTPDIPPAQGAQPRLTPRARVSAAVTTADPLLTRMALGKSNDGNTFGMFMQVFADGTVIDSEGVHRVGQADLKPLVEAIQNGELSKVRGHCGTPSNDFIEYVHVVIYERRMGRLQAHSFSYAGNPQGCDNGIRYLHTALENLQTKLSRPPAVAANSAPGAVTSAASMASPAPTSAGGTAVFSAPPLPDPATPATSGAATIPLSPEPPR
ncbi:hypothetical protein OJF2_53480 [Aquisphaera giovannonii]|uniref:Uncharacterized protein n=1 Tax=Aquisphaera giovannonii TaxID=406548 RepID=A0A5B9W865_9BACT|nr:hypothetical protein [Aquisphaera giovannonii]QEH36763.1 hypothetical protein OJF2_53480 [Aquisphaera giovannonii]